MHLWNIYRVLCFVVEQKQNIKKILCEAHGPLSVSAIFIGKGRGRRKPVFTWQYGNVATSTFFLYAGKLAAQGINLVCLAQIHKYQLKVDQQICDPFTSSTLSLIM